METLLKPKFAGPLIVLVMLTALGPYFEIPPVIVASGIVALVVLGAGLAAMLRPQAVCNAWQSPTDLMPDNAVAAMAICSQMFFRTGKESFTDDRPEPIDEDIPAGGPLFNSICYHLGQSWQLHDISISAWGHLLSAHLGIGATVLFELVLMEFDDGWMLAIQPKKEATVEHIRQFVCEAHDVICGIPDVHDVRWFKSDALHCGCFHEGEFELGTMNPCDLDNGPEVCT